MGMWSWPCVHGALDQNPTSEPGLRLKASVRNCSFLYLALLVVGVRGEESPGPGVGYPAAIGTEGFDSTNHSSGAEVKSGWVNPETPLANPAEEQCERPDLALSVCGADSLYQTDEPGECRLRLDWARNDVGWCSGSLVGSRYILTAGHCVYNSTKIVGGWVPQIQAFCGSGRHDIFVDTPTAEGRRVAGPTLTTAFRISMTWASLD
jgi:hypothetical protein